MNIKIHEDQIEMKFIELMKIETIEDLRRNGHHRLDEDENE